MALEAAKELATLADIARRYKVNANLKWKKELLERLPEVFQTPRHAGAGAGADAFKDREAELLRKIGQLTLENDFLARGIERIR